MYFYITKLWNSAGCGELADQVVGHLVAGRCHAVYTPPTNAPLPPPGINLCLVCGFDTCEIDLSNDGT